MPQKYYIRVVLYNIYDASELKPGSAHYTGSKRSINSPEYLHPSSSKSISNKRIIHKSHLNIAIKSACISRKPSARVDDSLINDFSQSRIGIIVSMDKNYNEPNIQKKAAIELNYDSAIKIDASHRKYKNVAQKLLFEFDRIADDNREKRNMLMKMFMDGKDVFDKEISFQIQKTEIEVTNIVNQKEKEQEIKNSSIYTEKKRPKFTVDLDEFKRIPDIVLKRRNNQTDSNSGKYSSISNLYNSRGKVGIKKSQNKFQIDYQSEKHSISSLASVSKVGIYFQKKPVKSVNSKQNSPKKISLSPNQLFSQVPKMPDIPKNPLESTKPKSQIALLKIPEQTSPQYTPRFRKPEKAIRCSSSTELLEMTQCMINKKIESSLIVLKVEITKFEVIRRVCVEAYDLESEWEYTSLRVYKSCQDALFEACTISHLYIHRVLDSIPPSNHEQHEDHYSLSYHTAIITPHLVITMHIDTMAVDVDLLMAIEASECWRVVEGDWLAVAEVIECEAVVGYVECDRLEIRKVQGNEVGDKILEIDRIWVSWAVSGMVEEVCVWRVDIFNRAFIGMASEEKVEFKYIKPMKGICISPCFEEIIYGHLAIQWVIIPISFFSFIEETTFEAPKPPLERTFFDYKKEKKLMISDIRSYMPLL